MTNLAQLVYTTLSGSAALTALVPVSNICPGYITDTSTVPFIGYIQLDNFEEDGYYGDNRSLADSLLVDIHLFVNANSSFHAIAQEIQTAMNQAGWTRDGYQNLPDDSNYAHCIIRYSKTHRNGV